MVSYLSAPLQDMRQVWRILSMKLTPRSHRMAGLAQRRASNVFPIEDNAISGS